MEQEKVKRRLAKSIMVCFCLAIFTMTLTTSLYRTFLRSVSSDTPYTSELILREAGNGIHAGDLQQINDDRSVPFCGYSLLPIGIKDEYGTYLPSVEVLQTNQYYDNYIPMTLIRGSFIDEKQANKEKRVAVISKQMALDLYQSLNIIGSDLILGDEFYQIIGIYEPPATFLEQFVGNGKEKILIPYRNTGAEVEHILLGDITIEDTVEDAKLKVVEAIGKKGLEYKLVQLKEGGQLLAPLYILRYILGISLILIMMKLCVAILKQGRKAYRRGIVNRYRTQLFKEKWKVFLGCIGALMLLILVMLWIYKGIGFELAIPNKYIPRDNIFDFKYYLSVYKEQLFSNHGVHWHNYYQDIYKIYQGITLGLALISGSFLGCTVFLRGLRLDKPHISAIDEWKIYGISLGIGLSTSFLLCLLLGLRFQVPFLTIFLTFLFLACGHLGRGVNNLSIWELW